MNILLTVLEVLLLLIIALMFLRVKITIEANDSTSVYLNILFVKIKLFPSKRKKIKLGDYESKRFRRRQEKEKQKELKKALSSAKKKQKKEEAKKKAAEKPKPKKTPGEIIDLVKLLSKLVGTFLARFAKRLRLDITKIHIILGGEDAAATAISYGVVCQNVKYLLAVLDSVTNVKPTNNRDVKIYANFLSDNTEVDIKIAASLRVWHVFDMLLSVAVKYVKEKFFKE